ncbi:hypothetical protein [Gloeothece verrucosa]|uniref:Uncharacterized protein n=1 Tax=Gloeothece verrucosa (strain PCC 7822) TaxID=497965 RepID=E0UCC3_GLOV7|nr:hypothetical protein [Gloeothece verrucosa]ADN12880.1 hypothetical protein Cyan7822_0860 [Gloeothece verrucosa PCC 7822]
MSLDHSGSLQEKSLLDLELETDEDGYHPYFGKHKLKEIEESRQRMKATIADWRSNIHRWRGYRK